MLWPLADNLGTVRDLTKQDGTIAVHYTYDSYGNVTSGDTSKTRYLFTGREFDTDTNLQYNRARWYDAEVGRWVSEDPLGFVLGGDMNLSRPVTNSLTNVTDPNGLEGRPANGINWLGGFEGFVRDFVLGPITSGIVDGIAADVQERARQDDSLFRGDWRQATRRWTAHKLAEGNAICRDFSIIPPLVADLGGFDPIDDFARSIDEPSAIHGNQSGPAKAMLGMLIIGVVPEPVPPEILPEQPPMAPIEPEVPAAEPVSPLPQRPTIDLGKQGKHVPGSRNFELGKSELTYPNPQELLKRFSGTGILHGSAESGWRETIDFGEPIGNWVDGTTAKLPTTRGTIHYGRDGGAHIVPSNPNPTK